LRFETLKLLGLSTQLEGLNDSVNKIDPLACINHEVPQPFCCKEKGFTRSGTRGATSGLRNGLLNSARDNAVGDVVRDDVTEEDTHCAADSCSEAGLLVVGVLSAAACAGTDREGRRSDERRSCFEMKVRTGKAEMRVV